jgi:hypothetical protein
MPRVRYNVRLNILVRPLLSGFDESSGRHGWPNAT